MGAPRKVRKGSPMLNHVRPQAVGHDAIDAMLARTQDQFPG